MSLISFTLDPAPATVFAEVSQATHLRIAKGARIAAETMAARGKVRLRGDVTGAGLGPRLANTWRADIYPKSPGVRTHSPAVVFRVNDKSKTKRGDSLGNESTIASAADIIRSHTTGAAISARNGLFLAIPTANTPKKGRRRATPTEVEVMFNQDLIIRPSKRGRAMLAFVDATKSLKGGKWRRASKGRAAKGRKAERVLMFILVPQVRLRARLRWPQIIRQLAAEWTPLFAREIATALNAGSNR